MLPKLDVEFNFACVHRLRSKHALSDLDPAKWPELHSHMLAVSVPLSICLAEDFPQRSSNP